MAQYGRWIDIDGNLHYFDTEKGDVVIYYKEKEPEVEYKIYVNPMPTNCYDCPMLDDNWRDDFRDYCHLESFAKGSIDVFYDTQNGHVRPDNCPLSTY